MEKLSKQWLPLIHFTFAPQSPNSDFQKVFLIVREKQQQKINILEF